VTKVRENIIFELDGRRPTRFLPRSRDRSRRTCGGRWPLFLPACRWTLPPRVWSANNFYVRNVTGGERGAWRDRAGHRPQIGRRDRLRLARRPAFAATKLKAMLEPMAVPRRIAPAFGLYFDCISRGSGSTTSRTTTRPISPSNLGQNRRSRDFSPVSRSPLGDHKGLCNTRACSR